MTPTDALERLPHEIDTLTSQLLRSHWASISNIKRSPDVISSRIAATDLSEDAISAAIAELSAPVASPDLSELAQSMEVVSLGEPGPALIFSSHERTPAFQGEAAKEPSRDYGSSAGHPSP